MGLEQDIILMKGKQVMGRTLFISIAITIAASVFGVFFNMVNPNGIEITGSGAPTMVPVIETEHEESVTGGDAGDVPEKAQIELITLHEAKAYFDRGEGFFVDARSRHSYYELHIPGAVSLSASRFDSQYEEFKDAIAKDALLIIYCQSITCRYSDVVADKLKGLGYRNIKIFAGGWTEWVQARYPVQGFKVYS